MKRLRGIWTLEKVRARGKELLVPAYQVRNLLNYDREVRKYLKSIRRG